MHVLVANDMLAPDKVVTGVETWATMRPHREKGSKSVSLTRVRVWTQKLARGFSSRSSRREAMEPGSVSRSPGTSSRVILGQSSAKTIHHMAQSSS